MQRFADDQREIRNLLSEIQNKKDETAHVKPFAEKIGEIEDDQKALDKFNMYHQNNVKE